MVDKNSIDGIAQKEHPQYVSDVKTVGCGIFGAIVGSLLTIAAYVGDLVPQGWKSPADQKARQLQEKYENGTLPRVVYSQYRYEPTEYDRGEIARKYLAEQEAKNRAYREEQELREQWQDAQR